ncbi:anti-sigma factor [Novosphingobium endophyticum]|uniref:Anti-sigma factor n=1 Tax=Novosphingobium endophyticum TaxID=1955250 RepID=A0A916X418_9SPHN|nr:hypothetical protein [Novosphingobium endophyticum]GGB96660.1 anti-sigma factor [Novosphingobium endophyticum]
MSVTDEELMAFADGELSGADAARVQAAIAADPALAERLEAERKLRMALRGHLDPVADEPVPQAWTAMIAAAAREDAEDEHKVISLAAARAEKAEKAGKAAKAAREARSTARGRPFMQRWGMGIAIAASLALGLFMGTRIASGPVTQRDGALMASGLLAERLDTQLASAQGSGSVRILTSFRREGGDYCRVFASGGTSGVACKDNAGWVLERTISGGAAQQSQYRQAGSADMELMAAAQEMADGAPLDAAQEEAAKAKGWRE